MKLSQKIIESFNLPQKPWNPDWDDSGFIFTLPCGIELSGLYKCNNSTCKMNCLEGLDGYIYIETKEQLEELISLTFDQIIEKIEKENKEFNKKEFLKNY